MHDGCLVQEYERGEATEELLSAAIQGASNYQKRNST
jgi:hypothetical protein